MGQDTNTFVLRYQGVFFEHSVGFAVFLGFGSGPRPAPVAGRDPFGPRDGLVRKVFPDPLFGYCTVVLAGEANEGFRHHHARNNRNAIHTPGRWSAGA